MGEGFGSPLFYLPAMSMQTMVAKRLLKKWLKQVDLQEGEFTSALMMYEKDEDVHLMSVTCSETDDGKIVVNRVLLNINIDEAI